LSVGISASVVEPQFGGKVGLVGPRVVEVMPRQDGLILAEVRDAQGAVMDSGRVVVDVTGVDGQHHPVELRFDTDLQVFEGSAGVALPPAPSHVDVTVRPSGEAPVTTQLTHVPMATVPSYGGQVVMVGEVAPEVRVDADGVVSAYVPTADGRLPEGHLFVNVQVGEPEPKRVELEFNDELGHYVAELGPDARPSGGVMSLDLEIEGRQPERGRVSHATVAPRRRLGGVVVVAGDYGLEVAPVEGELQATIADTSGVYVSAPPPRMEVHVVGRPAPVVMRWDASRRIYVAPLPSGVDVETAPIRVEVVHAGRRHRGHVHLRGPHPGRGRGHARGQARGPRGPNARVTVEHPTPSARVDVQVNVPAPPRPHVEVRVGHPAPRGRVVVEHRGHGKHRKHRSHRRGRGRGRGHRR
jgi:hypothetical protein